MNLQLLRYWSSCNCVITVRYIFFYHYSMVRYVTSSDNTVCHSMDIHLLPSRCESSAITSCCEHSTLLGFSYFNTPITHANLPIQWSVDLQHRSHMTNQQINTQSQAHLFQTINYRIITRCKSLLSPWIIATHLYQIIAWNIPSHLYTYRRATNTCICHSMRGLNNNLLS